MTGVNPKLIHVPKHRRDRLVGAVLEDSLRKQYGRKNIRVVRGDSVRVMRGEYKGVEGKVEKVNTEQATFHIEGIQREKIRGGQVKVPIHSSNVMVISLNLDDDYRSAKLHGAANPGSTTPAVKKGAKEKKKEEDKE